MIMMTMMTMMQAVMDWRLQNLGSVLCAHRWCIYLRISPRLRTRHVWNRMFKLLQQSFLLRFYYSNKQYKIWKVAHRYLRWSLLLSQTNRLLKATKAGTQQPSFFEYCQYWPHPPSGYTAATGLCWVPSWGWEIGTLQFGRFWKASSLGGWTHCNFQEPYRHPTKNHQEKSILWCLSGVFTRSTDIT